jgi:magnesium-transporting ATPase (P-type)
LARLGGSEESALSAAEAARRLAQHGPNQLPPPERLVPVVRFLLQFHNPLIYVLLAAAAVTYGLEDYIDATVIMAVVIINAIIGLCVAKFFAVEAEKWPLRRLGVLRM